MTRPQNLLQLLVQTATRNGDNGMFIYAPGKTKSEPTFLSYKKLLVEARRLATSIQAIPGTSTDTVVLIHLDNHLENIKWLWATIAAGRIPAMSTPFTNDLVQRRKHIQHLQTVLKNPIVITQGSLVVEFLHVEDLKIHSIEKLGLSLQESNTLSDASAQSGGDDKKADDIAALMLTSGSTGNAKAVTLRHGQVMNAVDGKSKFHNTTSEDTLLNWIGMDHVANLTEIHLHAMWLGANQIHVQAADVIANALTFIELVDRHRVVYSFAPNFFLAKVQKALQSGAPHGQYDLSSLSALISGGEANSTALCDELTQMLAPFGAKRDFIRPGFGMTETCAGSIYNKECPDIDVQSGREYTSLGHCINDMEMRVSGANGVCAAGEVGQLEVRGANIFNEYFNNPKATEESFLDGWFVTGDLAFLDAKGRLNMVGREKESLNINGVKYYPHEIEGAIEDAQIPGVTPSFTATFSHRLPGAATETFCVVYLPAYADDDIEARIETRNQVRITVMNHCMSRPYKIIPLDRPFFQKTALGKLSRAKIRTAFVNGTYSACIQRDDDLRGEYNGTGAQTQPSTETEKLVQSVFCNVFELQSSEVGVDMNVFDIGCSSLEVFQIKYQLQNMASLPDVIPVTTIIGNPTVKSLSTALEPDKAAKVYDRVVTLRSGGSKAPLWLIHPGVGEVLVFLQLANLIHDRPVYALRARGFDGEEFFGSVEEMANTYREAIQAKQSDGPYTIAGYSYGGTLGFEITKKLVADGHDVPFLAVFDQPPHIKERMRLGGWADVLMTLVKFFDLIPDKQMEQSMASMLKQATSKPDFDKDEVLQLLLETASVDALQMFGLDKKRLGTWTSLALNSHTIAADYEPSGHVPSIEVLYGQPIEAVARTKQEWRDGKLSGWMSFADSVELHEVAGHHYTLLAAENVASFHKTLMARLKAKGF